MALQIEASRFNEVMFNAFKFCIKALINVVPGAVMVMIVVNSNPADGEVYSIQYYVIKFVSDLRQVGAFLRLPGFLHQ